MTSSNGIISALLAICAGNSSVNSPHKDQWRGALIFSLTCAWINAWANNAEAGDLRRHRAHYDVIVINKQSFLKCHDIKLHNKSLASKIIFVFPLNFIKICSKVSHSNILELGQVMAWHRPRSQHEPTNDDTIHWHMRYQFWIKLEVES